MAVFAVFLIPALVMFGVAVWQANHPREVVAAPAENAPADTELPAVSPAAPVPVPEAEAEPPPEVEEAVDHDPTWYVAADVLAELPRPAIDTILPPGLETVAPTDLLPLAAVPNYDLIPAFVTPESTEPVLALEADTNTVIEPIPGRWTVVGEQPGWVRVIVPVGRGALPSVDAAAVNHHAVWVPADLVTLEDEPNRIVVSLSERRLQLFDGDDEVASFAVGVGIPGVTETPVGVCSVIARVIIQTGAESLLTSCQSEQLDGFAGANWATIAVHEGAGFNLKTGGAVSNGCVRVPPAMFQQYLDNIRIGTPVIVVP